MGRNESEQNRRVKKKRLSASVNTYCNNNLVRNLVELEIGVAEDVTEDGLLALAGRSAQQNDQECRRFIKYTIQTYIQFIGD